MIELKDQYAYESRICQRVQNLQSFECLGARYFVDEMSKRTNM